jgi:plastocyanin
MVCHDKNSESKPRTYGLGALFLSFIIIITVSAATVCAADIAVVSQKERKFTPDWLDVSRGSIVRIMNDDKVTHHVYVDSPGMTFDSGEQPIGTTVDLKFDRAGVYEVLCAIHPTMHLKVNVK